MLGDPARAGGWTRCPPDVPSDLSHPAKWGLCFIPNCRLSTAIYVWWHIWRMYLKGRRDFKIPLEALFSCLGLADVYQICSNYDLWNEPWWEKWYLNCPGCIFIYMNHLPFGKKVSPFLLHFQTFLTTYKNHHQNWQGRRKRMSILLYLILHSPTPGTTVLCVHHIALLLSDDCIQGRDGLLWWWGTVFCFPAAAVCAGFWQIQQGLHSYPTHTHTLGRQDIIYHLYSTSF